MKTRTLLALTAALGFSAPSLAQPTCDTPRARSTSALEAAIAMDDSMAQTLDATATACQRDAVCEQARARCTEQLATTLQRQVGFDDNAYLRDMLLPFQGQTYRMTVPIGQGSALTDVSCNADPAQLAVIAARRKGQADRRRQLLAEYPRWVAWAVNEAKRCNDQVVAFKAQEKQRQTEAAAAASAAATAAAAAAASAKAKEDADRLRRESEDKFRQQQLDAQKAADERLAEERRAREDAEARAKREKEDAVAQAEAEARKARDQQTVEQREAAKAEARAKRDELLDKEKERAKESRREFERQRELAQLEHEKKLAELRSSSALSDTQRQLQLDEEERKWAASEKLRSDQAMKEANAAGEYDRSDERQRGTIAAHGAGGYFSLSSASGGMLGGQATLRHGFFATAPAEGMASGVELRAIALFLTGVGATGGNATVISISPQLRYWWGRLGFGAAFEWNMLNSTIGTDARSASTLALGPELSLAAFDNPSSRMVISLRWMPILSDRLDKIVGELETGFGFLSVNVQAGLLRDSGNDRTGWFFGAGLGGRLRW